jgi:hypothetical protein
LLSKDNIQTKKGLKAHLFVQINYLYMSIYVILYCKAIVICMSRENSSFHGVHPILLYSESGDSDFLILSSIN